MIIVIDIFSFKKTIPNSVGQSKLPALVEIVTNVRFTLDMNMSVSTCVNAIIKHEMNAYINEAASIYSLKLAKIKN